MSCDKDHALIQMYHPCHLTKPTITPAGAFASDGKINTALMSILPHEAK